MDPAEKELWNLPADGRSDEQLIRAYCADPPDKEAGEELARRCIARIQKTVKLLVFRGAFCPSTEDRNAFFEDVCADALTRLVEEIHTFNFVGSFDGWLIRVTKSAALDRRRKILGRGKEARPVQESIEALTEAGREIADGPAFRSRYWSDPSRLVRDREHKELLRELLQRHAQASNHGAVSGGAIGLHLWDDLSARDIADRYGTSERSVWRLFAVDFVELRTLLSAEFHVSSVRHV